MMTERHLQKLLVARLQCGFKSDYRHVRVQRSYQPRYHSAPEDAAIVFHRIAYIADAWPSRHFDGKNGEIIKQRMSVTYQFNAIVNPPAPYQENSDDLTAGDLLEEARIILIRDEPEYRKCGVKMLFPNVFNVNFIRNQSNNWEDNSSFDMTFCYVQTYRRTIPVISEICGKIISI